MLIRHGAAAYRTLVWIARGAMLAGAGLSVLGLLPLLRERRLRQASEAELARSREERRRQAPLSTRSGAYDETEIRSCLIQFFDTMPAKFTPALAKAKSGMIW